MKPFHVLRSVVCFFVLLRAAMATVTVCEPQPGIGNTDEDVPPGPYGYHSMESAGLQTSYDFWYEVSPTAGEVINSFEVYTGVQYGNGSDQFSAFYTPTGWNCYVLIQPDSSIRIFWTNKTGQAISGETNVTFGFDHPHQGAWDEWLTDTDTCVAHSAEPDGEGYRVHVPASFRDGFSYAYVSKSGSHTMPFATWETAATNIQDAIAALSSDPDALVLVSNGVYTLSESIQVERSVILRSLNGPSHTFIDGDDRVGCIDASHESVIVDGFTLMHGRALQGGGIDGRYYTARNCVIRDNTAQYSGGGAFGGTLINCTVVRNRAAIGGGVSHCQLYNCILYYNEADIEWDNADHSEFNRVCSSADVDPAGFDSIITNVPGLTSLCEPHVVASSPCLNQGLNQGWMFETLDLDGQIRVADCSVDLGVDEYLAAGAVGALEADVISDVSQAAVRFPVTFEVDISGQATGYRCEFDDGTVVSNQCRLVHAFELPGSYEVVLTAWNGAGTSSDTVTVQVVAGYTNYVSLSGMHVPPFTNWVTAATNIQAAVAANTLAGGVVLVSNGTYNGGGTVAAGLTNRLAITNPVTVRSVNGPSVTKIVGAGPMGSSAIRCVYVGDGAVLTGFGLENGCTVSGTQNQLEGLGGGVCCARAGSVSNCLFAGNQACRGGGAFGGTCRNCTFIGNEAEYGGGSYQGLIYDCNYVSNLADNGGGAYAGKLHDCVFSNNTAQFGGAVAGYAAMLYNCLLVDNQAEGNGGGTSEGMLYNCIVKGNTASIDGGGSSYATLYNCEIEGNSAGYYGGGVQVCLVRNSIIVSNVAASEGGGAQSAILENCTVAGNTAVDQAGGIEYGSMQNCIVYRNTAPSRSNHWGGTFSYSCTAPMASGTGNDDADPLFVSLSDLRVRYNSPCVNAGQNESWMEGGQDLADQDRVVADVVDMGAYERRKSEINADGSTWQHNNQRTGEAIEGPQSFPLSCQYVLYTAPCTPVIAGRRLIVVSAGNLNAYDASSGVYLWTFQTNLSGHGSFNARSVTVAGRTVLASLKMNYGYAGKVIAVDLETGQFKWEHSLDSFNATPPVVRDGVVYVGGVDSTFRALDVETGELIWQTADLVDATDFGAATLGESLVYVIAGVGSYSYLQGIDVDTGKLLWSSYVPRYSYAESAPVFYSNRVYVALNHADPGGVYVYNATNGAYLWNYSMAMMSKYVTPALAEDKMFMVAGTELHAYNASVASTSLWSFTPTNAYALSSPVVADGVVYVCGSGSSLYALDAATGTELWHSDVGVTSFEPFVHQGYIFCCMESSQMFAYSDGSTWRDQSPVVTAPGPHVMTVGSSTGFAVCAYDPDYEPLQLTCSQAPVGASFVDSNFAWTATAEYANTTNLVTFTADDRWGTPNSVSSTTVPIIVLKDGDQDGLDDGWEWTYFGSLNAVPLGDDDGDTVMNYNEYVAGTAPDDDQSYFLVECVDSIGSDTNHEILVDTAPGRLYSIEYLDNTVGSNVVWSTFANTNIGYGTWLETGEVAGTYTFIDDEGTNTTGSSPVNGHRYYRIRVELP